MEKIDFDFVNRGEYLDMQNIVCSILGREMRTEFSVFRGADDQPEGSDWIVEYPDITSTEPLVEGTFTLEHERGEQLVTNPTWADVIEFFDTHAFGDHIFFEGIYRVDDRILFYAGA